MKQSRSLQSPEAVLIKRLSDREWRLANLYSIRDPWGKIVQFTPNEAQVWYAKERHWWNLLTKARRAGFSTRIGLGNLDRAIFNDTQTCGLIDFKLDDGKGKMAILQEAWERIGLHIPGVSQDTRESIHQYIHNKVKLTSRGETWMEWSNGSSYSCSTTFRGGTLQALHISEFGPICDERPRDAQNIIDGAFPAVATGCTIDIESTYKGPPSGLFYDLIEEAQGRMGAELHKREFKFLFFGFQMDSKNQLPVGSVHVTPETNKVFAGWEKDGVNLTEEQKMFWANEHRKMKGRAFREWPATPQDMFRAPIEGAIYGDQVSKLKAQGRFGDFYAQDFHPIYAAWDLGHSDSTAIWLIQVTKLDFRALAYYESNGQPIDHYASVIATWERDLEITVARHLLPHDAAHHSLSGKTFLTEAKSAGLRNCIVVPRTTDKWIGINEARGLLDSFCFHTRCKHGLQLLASYRKDVKNDNGRFKEQPLHDHTSHCADAFRTFADAFKLGLASPNSFGERRRGKLEVIKW